MMENKQLNKNSTAFILMSRVPLAGQTKTRLQTHLSPEVCASLHTCFLRDLLQKFNALHQVDLFMAYTPHDQKQVLLKALEAKNFLAGSHQPTQIEQVISPYHQRPLRIFPQRGSTLGERMQSAAHTLLLLGYKKVFLMGTDVPSVPLEQLQGAIQALDKHYLCLAPTKDGGYYLAGFTFMIAQLFEDTPWGTKTVLDETLLRLDRSKINYAILPSWHDVDTFEDLNDLYHYLKQMPCEGVSFPAYTHSLLCKIFQSL